jgi:hypothetical protein
MRGGDKKDAGALAPENAGIEPSPRFSFNLSRVGEEPVRRGVSGQLLPERPACFSVSTMLSRFESDRGYQFRCSIK